MSTSTPSYSIEQQIHCLSMLSNAGFGYMAPNFAALQNQVSLIVNTVMQNSTIQGLLGTDWQQVWGPVVFSNLPTASTVVADNTMMLYYSPSQSLVVIAIAGTNADSIFDWDSEDFSITTLVPWSTVVGGCNGIPAKAGVSAGTALGLSKLLTMTDTNRGNVSMLSALGTLLSTSAGGLQLAVSGHSLGGALSPSMALYLNDLQQNSGTWNSSKNVTSVTAWPTAGPTPGDADFASHLSGGVTTYTSVYNSIDVVPHAWMATSLAAIPGLYAPTIPVSDVVSGIVVKMAADTAKIFPSYYWQASQWQSMPGTFDTTTDTNATTFVNNLAAKYPTYASAIQALAPTIRFLWQAAYQHTVAYSAADMLNIESYSAEYKAITQQLDPNHKTFEDYLLDALIRMIEKYLHIPTAVQLA